MNKKTSKGLKIGNAYCLNQNANAKVLEKSLRILFVIFIWNPVFKS